MVVDIFEEILPLSKTFLARPRNPTLKRTGNTVLTATLNSNSNSNSVSISDSISISNSISSSNFHSNEWFEVRLMRHHILHFSSMMTWSRLDIANKAILRKGREYIKYILKYAYFFFKNVSLFISCIVWNSQSRDEFYRLKDKSL